jgi:uncharacterized protein (DUF58 family)
MWIIFMTLLILPFFMFGLLCYIYGNIKVELGSTAHVVNKEEAIPITVQMTNITIFPITNLRLYLTYHNSYSLKKFTKEINVSLDSRTSSSVVCNLLSDYAGNIEINLGSFKIYDYLKLFSMRKKLKNSLKAAVLPQYYELERETASQKRIRINESDNHSPYKSGDDPSEVFAIREYREGDRPQRIHWKLSTKVDHLMIKEFSNPIDCSDILFISLCIPEQVNVLYYIDSILECALSISYTFLLKEQPHYIAWYDQSNGMCRRIRVTQEKDLFEAVDGLLQAKSYNLDTDVLTAYLAEYPYDQYTDFIYITGGFLVSQLDNLACVKAQGTNMIYLSDLDDLIDAQHIPAELIKKANDMGINFLPVDVTNVKRDLELF